MKCLQLRCRHRMEYQIRTFEPSIRRGQTARQSNNARGEKNLVRITPRNDDQKKPLSSSSLRSTSARNVAAEKKPRQWGWNYAHSIRRKGGKRGKGEKKRPQQGMDEKDVAKQWICGLKNEHVVSNIPNETVSNLRAPHER